MKRLIPDQKGQSMVEFALILPILLLLVLAIIEFGFMFSDYLSLSNASRESVRYVSLGGSNSGAIERGKEVAVNLEPTKMIFEISPLSESRERGDSVQVGITYDYEFITPVISVIFGDSLELYAEATMRVE